MGSQSYNNSLFSLKLAMLLARSLPTVVSYSLVNRAASLFVKKKNLPIIQSVRSNQRVVRGDVSEQELDGAVQAVFSHAGRCFVDLYRSMLNPDLIQQLVIESQQLKNQLAECARKKEGVLLVISHLSNFDLALLALTIRGLRAQVLSYSHPGAAYQLQNNIRASYGTVVTPITSTALHSAMKRLADGGVVITGIDRPVDDNIHHTSIPFFGRPAALPVGHIRMAIKTKAKVIVFGVKMQLDGLYTLQVSELLEMKHYADKDEEILLNSQSVLYHVEKFIKAAPEQWLMYYPVWPQYSPSSLQS